MPRAVCSLWKVDDAATAVLMERFHRNLWEKKMPRLEAMREAQLWLLKEGGKDPNRKLRAGLVRPDLKIEDGDAVSPPSGPPSSFPAIGGDVSAT